MMHKVEIKSYFSSDLLDLEVLKIGEKETFYFPLELSIGCIGEEAADIFSIMIISSNLIDNKDHRNKIVLPIFDFDLLKTILQRIIDYCNEQSDPYFYIRKYFDWEYEGYMK